MIEPYLSSGIQQQIEQRYYARVNEQARLERLICNPHFMTFLDHHNDLFHVGLYSDHGVMHVRDVAGRILRVLEQVHGTLIPTRAPIRIARMRGYGVLVAYFHDIGMQDFSEFGRAMHPEFAAREPFNPELDDIFSALWEENSGNLAWHLTNLVAQGRLDQPPDLVLREMLALSMAHSKSKVPVADLNDPAALRDRLLATLRTDLQTLYLSQQQHKLRRRLAAAAAPPAQEALRARLAEVEGALAEHQSESNPDLGRHYRDFEREAFRWLLSPEPALHDLREDVIDSLRALRCADALRQRGTVLTTSSGYEIFVDQRSANAVFGLRLGNDRLYLLELPDVIAAGEANLASSELDPACDLRISFHRGAFTHAGATGRAAQSAALVVHDIMQDVIDSFVRVGAAVPGIRPAGEIQVVLEETDDNPDFVEAVRARLIGLEPEAAPRLRIAPSLKMAAGRELRLYLDAPPLDWDAPTRQRVLDKLGVSGHLASEIDRHQAFTHVRLIHLEPGGVLLEAGAPSAFVYIPLDPGLKIIPESGHLSFVVQPWMPLGVTGVIRGAARNATVRAEQAVSLLMIPHMVYLKQWHRTHSPASFREAIRHLD